MRDPDLVQQAERAAIALERAWGRWRVMHGLGTDPAPPVSSYVGYSLEDPWGQPRVVFGIGAEEAERLAALLDGHDCVGPVHAEVTGRPDWRQAAAGPPTARAWPAGDLGGIPAQAPQPAAEELRPAQHADTDADDWENTIAGQVGAAPVTAAPASSRTVSPGPAGSRPVSTGAVAAGPVTSGAAPSTREPGDAAGTGSAAAATPEIGAESAPGVAEREPGDSGPLPAATAPAAAATAPAAAATAPAATAQRPPLARAFPAAPLLPAAVRGGTTQRRHSGAAAAADSGQAVAEDEQNGTVQFPALTQPGIVAFRRRQEQAASQAPGLPSSAVPGSPGLAGSAASPGSQVPSASFAAAPDADDDDDLTASPGPGYRGPRYRGFPPRYQSGAPAEEPPGSLSSAPAPPPAVEAAAEPARAELSSPRQVSRLGRSRRSGHGAHEAGGWPHGDHAATDTAV
jgi:hypothetical protein